MKLLSISNLRKSFGATKALRNASLELGAGETLALMGENGAGKSTLIKILAGAINPDGGTIVVDGQTEKLTTPADSYRHGLRFIHQELTIVPALSVAENIYLGRSYPTRFGLIDWKALAANTQTCLAALGISHILPNTHLSRLSVGDRMLVKIASAFLDDADAPAKIFVMDEPTAALAGEESERLFSVIAKLKQRGCGIIYVSHRLDEVLSIADRITVMRDGETRATLNAKEATKSNLIEEMTGRQGSSLVHDIPPIPRQKTVLSVANLEASGLKNITFTLDAGEIFGCVGLTGSGPERLIKSLIGEATAGSIRLDEQTILLRDAADAWRSGLAIAPRERRTEGLLLMQDIASNVALPHLTKISRLRTFLNPSKERAQALAMGIKVRLKASGPTQKARELSGGNQQKVMFARAVAGNPRVLLLDEPTRGVDVGAKFDIYALLRELANAGRAILIVSSDHEEILALCTRIAIFRDGRISEIVPNTGLTQQSLLALCYGEQRGQ